MTITYRVLGKPGRDNALLVVVDSGQAITRLLFDCGDECLSELPFADVQAIDQLLFSHLHMDHVGGFDSFFRCTFDRSTKPNRIWGPPETARILQHRFQGFLWNLHDQTPATWRVSDVHPGEIRTTRFELSDAFAVAYDEGAGPCARTVCVGEGFAVEAITMDHRTPTLAFVVREATHRNIDASRLASLGLHPGPWLKELKEGPAAAASLDIDGVAYSADELRSQLIVETPGDSIAYLTDFLLDESAMERLTDFLRGCRVIVCEGQYRHADIELAHKNFHMTTVLSATLAERVGAEDLILFHLSDRYVPAVWREMLQEARQIFPKARFPPHWRLDAAAEPTPNG